MQLAARAHQAHLAPKRHEVAGFGWDHAKDDDEGRSNYFTVTIGGRREPVGPPGASMEQAARTGGLVAARWDVGMLALMQAADGSWFVQATTMTDRLNGKSWQLTSRFVHDHDGTGNWRPYRSDTALAAFVDEHEVFDMCRW